MRTIYYAGCVIVAVWAAALATGFPYLPEFPEDESYERIAQVETRFWQAWALGVAVVSSLVTAHLMRPASWRWGRGGFAFLVLMLVVLAGNHLLLVQPIWGFHHIYTLGLLGWLFIGGAEGGGLPVVPNFCSLPATIAAYAVLIMAGRTFREMWSEGGGTREQESAA